MATKKTNGSKRQSPSRERLLALALVRLKECVLAVERAQMNLDNLRATNADAEQLQAELEKAETDRKEAIEQAEKCLADNDYAELESIATRVKRIEDEMKAALEVHDGTKLGQLGPALERAKRGLPPLTVTEKKPKVPTERKPRTAKKVAETIAAFTSGTKFVAANGDPVTAIRASENGKQCSVQCGDEEWLDVEPAELSIAPEPEKG